MPDKNNDDQNKLSEAIKGLTDAVKSQTEHSKNGMSGFSGGSGSGLATGALLAQQLGSSGKSSVLSQAAQGVNPTTQKMVDTMARRNLSQQSINNAKDMLRTGRSKQGRKLTDGQMELAKERSIAQGQMDLKNNPTPRQQQFNRRANGVASAVAVGAATGVASAKSYAKWKTGSGITETSGDQVNATVQQNAAQTTSNFSLWDLPNNIKSTFSGMNQGLGSVHKGAK